MHRTKAGAVAVLAALALGASASAAGRATLEVRLASAPAVVDARGAPTVRLAGEGLSHVVYTPGRGQAEVTIGGRRLTLVHLAPTTVVSVTAMPFFAITLPGTSTNDVRMTAPSSGTNRFSVVADGVPRSPVDVTDVTNLLVAPSPIAPSRDDFDFASPIVIANNATAQFAGFEGNDKFDIETPSLKPPLGTGAKLDAGNGHDILHFKAPTTSLSVSPSFIETSSPGMPTTDNFEHWTLQVADTAPATISVSLIHYDVDVIAPAGSGAVNAANAVIVGGDADNTYTVGSDGLKLLALGRGDNSVTQTFGAGPAYFVEVPPSATPPYNLAIGAGTATRADGADTFSAIQGVAVWNPNGIQYAVDARSSSVPVLDLNSPAASSSSFDAALAQIPAPAQTGPGSAALPSGGVFLGSGYADYARGTSRQDVLKGNFGDDVLEGGPGQDWLAGDAGNDTFRARDGFVDRIDGGPGTDGGTFDAGDVVTTVP